MSCLYRETHLNCLFAFAKPANNKIVFILYFQDHKAVYSIEIIYLELFYLYLFPIVSEIVLTNFEKCDTNHIKKPNSKKEDFFVNYTIGKKQE